MSTQIVRYVSVASQKQYQGLAPWTPDQFDIAAWYDAADLSTISESAGFVTQWDDKSGNDSHMTNGLGPQPTTGGLTLNGLNMIRFNQQYLSNSGVFTGYSDFDYTFIYVARPITAGTYTAGNLLLIGAASTGHKLFPLTVTNPVDGFKSTTGGTYGGSWSNTSYSSAGEDLITSFMHDSATPARTLWKNGLYVNDTSVVGTGIADDLTIGGTGDVDTAIGELIVFGDRIKDATRQITEGYLAHKWGLAGLLPSDHPWKNAMPYVMG